LLDIGALGIRFPDDSHAGGVQHHLAQVLFHVVLQLNGGKLKLENSKKWVAASLLECFYIL